MREFYVPFAETLSKADEGMEKFAREVDMMCPQCGSQMVEKFGRFGKFLSCSNYPTCKYIHREAIGAAPAGENGAAAPAPTESDIACPKCGKMLVEKVGRFGKFLGCPGYPECKHIHKAAAKTTGVQCVECKQGEYVEKFSKKGAFYGCSRYPDCKATLPAKPVGRECPQCHAAPLIEKGWKNKITGVRCSAKGCDYSETIAGMDNEEAEAEPEMAGAA